MTTSDAIRAIEATDPAEIQSRLKELASSLEQHGTQSSELMSALTATQTAQERARRRQHRLQLILNVVVLVAVIAVAVLILNQ